MGSNMSTVNEKKAPITTMKATILAPKATSHDNEHVAHRWPTAPPIKHEERAPRPKLSINYKNSIDDQANIIEIIRPPVPFLDHSANINRVISFHSSACWRDYFQASKHSDKLIVIFFSAKWCGFCRYMDPVLDDLASQYTDVEIHKMDIDELFDISREFKVYAMPTFLFFKRRMEIDKVVGTSREDIRRKIEKHRAS